MNNPKSCAIRCCQNWWQRRSTAQKQWLWMVTLMASGLFAITTMAYGIRLLMGIE